MNNKLIVIDIPFNTAFRNINPDRLKKDWIDYRINIFMNYTFNSLVNQTNQNFLCFLRYDKESESLIFDALSKYPKLPNNIIFTPNFNKEISQRIENYDFFYHVRLDSDNMYHREFIDKLHKFKYYDGLECILCQSGYIYDSVNDKLGTWHFESPPFYTFLYKTQDYINNFRYKLKSGHASAIEFKHEIFPERNFVVVIHEKNLLSKFESSFIQGYVTDEKLKKSIMKECNIINKNEAYKPNNLK